MGVDITGLNPVITTERPAHIDYSTASEAEKESFWEAMDKYREENPGEYFQSNWWAWRPIHALCDIVQSEYKLRINTSRWGENSGGGLRNPKTCNKLADALQEYISKNLGDQLKEDDDVIYFCLGCWNTNEGSFIPSEIEEKLNEKYAIGTILHASIVLEDGMIVQPSHSTRYSTIKRWINFLRNCGGFAIY
jgi:hypothetical protein